MNIAIPSVNINQTSIKPYKKKNLEFSTLFINLSSDIQNSIELFFKYSQVKTAKSIDRNIDNSIKAFFDNGGENLYLLNYDIEEFNLNIFIEYVKKACDNLRDIEVIAIPTLLQSQIQEKESAKILSILGEYSNNTDRIFLMDVNQKMINEHLDIFFEGAIYYPWLKNKAGELIAPSSVASGLMSKIAAENTFFHSIANKNISGFERLEFELEKDQILELQKEGINPILFMYNDGLKIWGVNAFNSKFKTINEVRVIKYIKRSLKDLMRDDLFEINSASLKDKVFSKVNFFLSGLWEIGALAGQSKEEAFVIDSRWDNNSNDGKLEFFIGVALSKPLEFINIKLERIQKDGMIENISVEV